MLMFIFAMKLYLGSRSNTKIVAKFGSFSVANGLPPDFTLTNRCVLTDWIIALTLSDDLVSAFELGGIKSSNCVEFNAKILISTIYSLIKG